MSNCYAAFLRGINVGGKRMLPMKELAAQFVKAGCTDVSTYIQSGNVVFKASPDLAAKVPALLHASLMKKFGFEVPIIVRSTAQLKALAKANPFLKAGAGEEECYVGFLSKKPGAAQVAQLDPHRSPPHEFKVLGSEVFFRFPGGAGIAKTKLTNAYFDSKLDCVCTVRNWRTLQAMIGLCA
jgi:uncharacterized protein (DUF1697 family)